MVWPCPHLKSESQGTYHLENGGELREEVVAAVGVAYPGLGQVFESHS